MFALSLFKVFSAHILVCSALIQQPLTVQPEPTGEPLVFGMSTALTGPAADLGFEMRAGVLAAFDEANRNGGINGRPLHLISYDDGYEPSATVPNMRRLIQQDQVLGVIGNVGTPTAVAALPIVCKEMTPFIFAYSGAGVLRREKPDPCVINYRASYAEETEMMVDALIEHAGISPQEIGFFTQRDAYGDAGFAGGIRALKRHGIEDYSFIAHGRYERNSSAVENAIADLLLAPIPPRAVVMVGTYAPCAKAILLAKEAGLEAIFLNVSFVGATSLAKALGDQGDGVIVTQVVPHILSDLPLVKQYRQAMRFDDKKRSLSFPFLEGYIAGRILCLGLQQTSIEISRPAVINSLIGLGKFDIGLGIPLLLAKGKQQASHNIWPTVINNGKVLPFEWNDFNK